MLPANQPGLAVPAGGPALSSPILPAQYRSLACPGCCCLSITLQQIEGLGPIPCSAAPQGGLILDPRRLLWPPSHGSSPPAQVPGPALGFVAWTSCVPAQFLHFSFLSPQICIAQGSSCQTTSPARLRKLLFGDKCAPNLSPGTAGTNWGVEGDISATRLEAVWSCFAQTFPKEPPGAEPHRGKSHGGKDGLGEGVSHPQHAALVRLWEGFY